MIGGGTRGISSTKHFAVIRFCISGFMVDGEEDEDGDEEGDQLARDISAVTLTAQNRTQLVNHVQ